MKKKLRKQPDPEMYRGGFLTYMDYAATGEGRTIELNFCYADSKKEAIERHLDRFIGADAGARKYFKVGVVAHDIKSKDAKELLQDVFNHSEGMWKALCEAGIEFHMKFYFNYS